MGRSSLGLRLILLIGAGLLFIIFLSAAIPGVADLPRATYNYSRRSPLIVMWNGMEFKLPPPCFRLGNKAQVAGSVTFFRDQFPSVAHAFSSITFKPPFPNDFGQNPEGGLQRWEQLNNSLWAIPNPHFQVINHYYSNARTAKNEFRYANTVLQTPVEKLMKIDCTETRRGWRFDYEGRIEDVPEAMSILEHGSETAHAAIGAFSGPSAAQGGLAPLTAVLGKVLATSAIPRYHRNEWISGCSLPPKANT
jgi:hypothetical protein